MKRFQTLLSVSTYAATRWPAATNIVLACPGDTRQELKAKVTQAMMRWWGR